LIVASGSKKSEISLPLATEAINPALRSLDRLSTCAIVEAMNRADREAVAAVQVILPQVAAAVDAIVARLSAGGRLFYLGAGTSGRLGVLDASECPPTFNTDPEMVQGVIAGGDYALRHAVEGAEDNREKGRLDLEQLGFSGRDAVVGIAASGALEFARECGALAIGLSCVPGSAVATSAELALVPETGAEIIAGSTRLKAGTATKMVLNMLSTGVMVRLGYTYGNLMVNVRPTNEKLRERAARLVAMLAEVPVEEARTLLEQGGDVKVAVLMKRFGLDRRSAELRLKGAGGRLTEALQAFHRSEPAP
jgi:N-acetylmuramic acid 6-phosphate etherase